MAMNNPFRERGMIRDPRRFFGRISEVQQIVERLAVMGSLSLVGDRQIGKSSLLFYIARQGWQEQPEEVRPSAADAWSQALKDHELHYFDLSLSQSAAGFYRQVLVKLDPDSSGENALLELQRAMTGRKVVLFLDEFEKAADNPGYPPDFFDALRGLAQTGELALVTATKTTLIDLVASGAIGTSPFYNIFTQLSLGPLADEEARALLQGTATLAEVSFADQDLAFAVDLAEGNPFKLQLLGRLLFEARQVGEVNLEQIEEQFWAVPEPGAGESYQPGGVSPNRPFLVWAGLFLVVAGAAGVVASLSGNLTIGYVSLGFIFVALILAGFSLFNTPTGEGL